MGLLDAYDEYSKKLKQPSDPYSGLSIQTQQGLINLDRQTAPTPPPQPTTTYTPGMTRDPRATIPHPLGTGELLTPEQIEKLKVMLRNR